MTAAPKRSEWDCEAFLNLAMILVIGTLVVNKMYEHVTTYYRTWGEFWTELVEAIFMLGILGATVIGIPVAGLLFLHWLDNR